MKPGDALASLWRSRLLRALGTGPNLITLSRLALLAVALGAITLHYTGVALAFGAGAGVTDYADGWLARRTGQVTRLGEILDQFCDVVLELVLLVTAIAAGALPVAVLIPYVLREIWVASIRRSSIELGENIPSCLTGKLKAAFIGWSALPLYAGIYRVGGHASRLLLDIGQAGTFIGLALTMVSGLHYTAAWIGIYERRGPAAARPDAAPRPALAETGPGNTHLPPPF